MQQSLRVAAPLFVDIAYLAACCLSPQVADEEAVQFRALNLLFGPLNVRGFPEPEAAHAMWGDFLRAVTAAGLNGAAMKASIICNHAHGPFQ